jgi:hypothetical protein
MITVLLFLSFTSGCAQKTAFYSDPPGALIFVDGEAIGRTPCEYVYKSSTSKTYLVEVQEDGYEPVKKTLATDEVDLKARNKWRAAGLIWSPLLIGSFFTKKLKSAYHFLLSKAEDTQQDFPDRHALLELPASKTAIP